VQVNSKVLEREHAAEDDGLAGRLSSIGCPGVDMQEGLDGNGKKREKSLDNAFLPVPVHKLPAQGNLIDPVFRGDSGVGN